MGENILKAFIVFLDEKKGKGDADPVIATLPEVKEHAARAIARAAKNGENATMVSLSTQIMLNCQSVAYAIIKA